MYTSLIVARLCPILPFVPEGMNSGTFIKPNRLNQGIVSGSRATMFFPKLRGRHFRLAVVGGIIGTSPCYWDISDIGTLVPHQRLCPGLKVCSYCSIGHLQRVRSRSGTSAIQQMYLFSIRKVRLDVWAPTICKRDETLAKLVQTRRQPWTN